VDNVRFPGNQVDPTVSPRFELGYRLANGWGGLQFGYRLLATQGSNSGGAGPSAFDQSGRLIFNQIDLAYVSREYSLDPNWVLRWGVGPRMMYLFFDAHLSFPTPATDPGSIFNESTTNHIQVYGPWAFLDLERVTRVPGLGIVGRVEGAGLFGRIHQVGAETLAGGAGAGPQFFYGRVDGSVAVETLSEILGVSYTVPQWNYSRFLLGYRYETFFDIGRAGDGRGQLDYHGIFLRAEFNY
jgi:hypothetical protein